MLTPSLSLYSGSGGRGEEVSLLLFYPVTKDENAVREVVRLCLTVLSTQRDRLNSQNQIDKKARQPVVYLGGYERRMSKQAISLHLQIAKPMPHWFPVGLFFTQNGEEPGGL